jgi:hypothetical protein
MRCLPIAVLIGVPKARHPKRRPVYERLAKVGESRACVDRRISRQWGIEPTKADSARGSTVACTSGSVIAVLALKRAR